MRRWLPRIAFIALMSLAAGSAFGDVEVTDDGVVFTFTDEFAQKVAVAGEFNGWSTDATPLTKGDDGVWAVILDLGPGKHEYKFVIDGQWTADPGNPVTSGAYGNSLVEIGSAGGAVKQAATSNTALSPKILLGGRFIGLYMANENEARGDQYELRRPEMDIDLDWSIRVNDITTIHLLTNINNENEETVTDFWRTSLNFDRGSIHMEGDEVDLFLFDNEAAGRFDDPFELVGGIGIYDHDFGYRQQGALGKTELGKLKLKAIYSDDFDNGGTTGPSLDSLQVEAEAISFADTLVPSFGANQVVTYDADDNDNDKDVIALRGKYPVGGGQLGASFRKDRGYNPGALTIVESTPGDTLGKLVGFGRSLEEWQALGGDYSLGGDGERPWRIRAEFLKGKAEVVGREGVEADVAIREVMVYDEIEEDSVLQSQVVVTSNERVASSQEHTIDESNRFYLGGDYYMEESNLSFAASWASESHDQSILATGIPDTLENNMHTIELMVTKGMKSFGESGMVRLDAELTYFDYDVRTPWANQMWFDFRNFWLEQSEHEVAYERMLLLGGEDVYVLRPSAKIEVTPFDIQPVEIGYKGEVAGVMGKSPKYMEWLFQLVSRPWTHVRFYSDTRIASYDDPVLELSDTYASTFLEVAYEFGGGVEVALSYGVDPIVIDEAVNEYNYIGRDTFLFERGANGDIARRDFSSLSTRIPDAEQALQDERRIQVEGIVRF